MIGLSLLLAIAVLIIKYAKTITIHHLCLLSIGVFAFFSYPLRYPFVAVIIAYSLANIRTKAIFAVKNRAAMKVVGIIMVGGLSWFMIKDIQFERKWGKLVDRSMLSNHEQLLDNYQKLYSQWNGDPLFLYNYGAILNRAEQYQSSNDVLMECTKYFNDYDVQMIIADNFEKLENRDNAERHYILASSRCPNRFVPLYKLMLMYNAMGQNAKARHMAETIISKPVKVKSGIVSQIKKVAQEQIHK